MEALIPAPADCEARPMIEFLSAQSMVPIEIHIRGVPSSNPGADQTDFGCFRGFHQSSRQMLCWI